MPSIRQIQWTLPQDWQGGRWVFCKCPNQLSYCSVSAIMASRKVLSPKLGNTMRLTYQYSRQRSACKKTSLMWISFTTPLNILTRGATLCGLLPSPHSLENPQTLPQVHLNQLSNLAKVDEASPPRDVPWNGASKKWKDHEKNRKSYERKRHQPEPFASVLAIYKWAGLMRPSLQCKSDRASLRLITCLQSLQVTDDPQTQASSCDGNLAEAPEVWAWHTNPSQPDMARHEKSNQWMQFVWGLALAGPDP